MSAARNIKDDGETVTVLHDFFERLALEGGRTYFDFMDLRTLDGLTSLHASVMANRVKVTSRLLELGCDPLAVDAKGNNCWHHLASSKEGCGIFDVRELQDEGKGGVRARNKKGRTPLHVACDSCGAGGVGEGACLVAMMLSRWGREGAGVDVPVGDEGDAAKYLTALHLACRSGGKEEAKALVEAGAGLEGDGKYPVLYEILGGAGGLDFLDYFVAEVMGGKGSAREELLGPLFFSGDEAGENVLFHLIDALGEVEENEENEEEDDENDYDEEEDDDPQLRSVLAKRYNKTQLLEIVDIVLEVASSESVEARLDRRRALDGRTALHLCVSRKQQALAKRLVQVATARGEVGELVGVMDKRKVTAGELAARTGQTKMSIYLHNLNR